MPRNDYGYLRDNDGLSEDTLGEKKRNKYMTLTLF